jgi:hypothetical protein
VIYEQTVEQLRQQNASLFRELLQERRELNRVKSMVLEALCGPTLACDSEEVYQFTWTVEHIRERALALAKNLPGD